MADPRDATAALRDATATAVAGLVALARSLPGGDPLRDEPASVFRPLEAAEPAPGASGSAGPAGRGR